MSEPLKLTAREIVILRQCVSHSSRTNAEAWNLLTRLDTFERANDEEQTFYLVTEADAMRAQISVKAIHDTLDLENRLAQDEYRLHQLEARNQQNSEHIAHLRQMLEKLTKPKSPALQEVLRQIEAGETEEGGFALEE